MVVMITPVAFSSIGYKTYVIFAVINAFIVPVVYFFYPETAYRSLEEMDLIFRKTSKGLSGWFGVVRTAHNLPPMYGKHGELLINYEETEEHKERINSVAGQGGIAGRGIISEKAGSKKVEDVDGSGEASETEHGSALESERVV